MAITVSAKTRVTVASGACVVPSASTYTVATGDFVVFPICTNTNGSTDNHTITKASGTATMGTVVNEVTQQSGGQFSIHYVPITAGGTISFSISADAVGFGNISCAPLVLTGVDTSTPKDQEAQGSSSTNAINVGLTTLSANTVVVVGGTDWNDLGNVTSSDLTDFTTFNGGGSSMSGGAGWKAVAAAGAMTGNLNAAGGSAADWDWGVVSFKVASGGTDGTATPAAIAATVTVPAVTKQAGSVTLPAAVVSTVAVPAPTKAAGSVTLPAAIVATAALPAATASAVTVVAPAAVASVVTLPAPTKAAGSTTAPAVITTTATLPAPTTQAGSKTLPVAITATVAVPASTQTYSGLPTPATIVSTAAVPAATASGGTTGTATPAAVASVVTLPAPTTQAGSKATPAAIIAPLTVPAASASGSAAGTATPAAVAAVTTIPAATASGTSGSTATPAVVASTVAMPAPTLQAGWTVAPARIISTVTVPQALPTSPATTTPATITGSFTLPAPSLLAGSVVQPNVIISTVTVPKPITASPFDPNQPTPLERSIRVHYRPRSIVPEYDRSRPYIPNNRTLEY